MNRWGARFGDQAIPVGAVDAIAGRRIVGWAAAKRAVKVEARVDGEVVACATPHDERPDVAAAYPGLPSAGASGFVLELPADLHARGGIRSVEIVSTEGKRGARPATLAAFDVASPVVEAALRNAPPTTIASPFPRDITDLVAARWPEDCADLASPAGQRRFARRLSRLMAISGLNSTPALVSYGRYLSATLAHCRFVEKQFPAINPRAAAGAADFHSKPNGVAELFPIIHQLYVLRSNGVAGDFAEFGCFKGYSSSMLSFACAQIGIEMHIFDSFEGLPPAEGSGYQAGQYAGSLDEVRENIARFGAIDAVQFHQGFFSDSLRVWRPKALMCLWMDVDLESSARDLLVVAGRLDARGTVFSHECPAGNFSDGEIVCRPGPDNPIGPMVERFEAMGRPLRGQHVSGYIGAFWAKDGGIAMVDTEVLFELAERRV